ncbi:probable carboxylesterase 15 [Panicum virgatum]|uniref:Alpha/beta hydrolase fold-3 domain-containing protein n=1 Tax=Panicum virgatum TaxID=38727 RepID=A0A8T0SBH6_PANVG|nr:probable carboxylesterase 15 [Panicum virgatum]KAG2595577.1 hypothetical protein PVAP13_5KG087048 [Panicum virgatum]
MSSDAAPHVVEDLFGVVRLLSDGSVVRGDESVLMPAGPFPDVPGVRWKDAVYDATRGLKVRVYRPPPPGAGGEEGSKLPVLVYFHGGGYCVGSYDHPMFHSCCQRFAAELPAVVLSVQYRLAPEHRLPAAVEDAATFFAWLRGQADPWLAESADLARTFVSGVSAGANLAHHVVVRLAARQLAADPVRVAGYVLLSAFFGSVERTVTEAESPASVSLTAAVDKLWRMALPVGASRDHPLANPFGPDSPSMEPLPLPPALVVAPGLDMLRGHMRRYAARLEEMGKAVELVEFAGEQHGFSVRGWGEANDELVRILKRFVGQMK